MKPQTPDYVRDLAKEMRKNPMPAEDKLWQYLRGHGILGYRFYRQYPIGRYIADFCCPEVQLIVELDGGIHNTERNVEYDKIRDRTLYCEGMTVLRFKNEDVLNNIGFVIDNIGEALCSLSLTAKNN